MGFALFNSDEVPYSHEHEFKNSALVSTNLIP